MHQNINYNLRILKDILRFCRVKLGPEEIKLFLTSALFNDKTYLASAAIVVKKLSISFAEFWALKDLSLEELSNYLTPVSLDFDYFASIEPEELMNAIKEMESFIKNNPLEAKKNREYNLAKITNIKNHYLESMTKERK